MTNIDNTFFAHTHVRIRVYTLLIVKCFFCSSQKCRYFSFADQPSSSEQGSIAGATSGDSEPVKAGATFPSVAEVLRSLSSARARGEGSEALTKILKEALQQHKKSEVGSLPLRGQARSGAS